MTHPSRAATRSGLARTVLAALVATALGVGGLTSALASVPGGTDPFENTALRGSGATPAGLTVTVTKKMIDGTQVSTVPMPVNASAPADEFLVPVNAKAAPGVMDLYQGFKVVPNAWNDIATLTFTFSKPVRDPRLHIAGTGGAVAGAHGNADAYWAGLELVSGSPAKPYFTKVAGFPDYTVTKTSVEPTRVYAPKTTSCGTVYMCGTAQLNGTVTAFTVKLRARNVRTGGDAGAPFLWGVFRVSFDEDDSDAPASYGAASHVVGSTFLGRGVTADHVDTISFLPRGLSAGGDTDDALKAGTRVARRGRFYVLTVPAHAEATTILSGWIDFNQNRRFDADERAQAVVGRNDRSGALAWKVGEVAKDAKLWLRLRLGGSARQVATPTGWADSGEAEDHQVLVGPARIGKFSRSGKKAKFRDAVRHRKSAKSRKSAHAGRSPKSGGSSGSGTLSKAVKVLKTVELTPLVKALCLEPACVFQQLGLENLESEGWQQVIPSRYLPTLHRSR